MPEKITIRTTISASSQHVWHCWTLPEHITQWNAAGDDWHCPKAENDLSVGGRFSYRMEARDGSFGFDFGGTYTAIEDQRLIVYTLDDDRTVSIQFSTENGQTVVEETFEAESENPIELQLTGWQMILDRFKRYCESIG